MLKKLWLPNTLSEQPKTLILFLISSLHKRYRKPIYCNVLYLSFCPRARIDPSKGNGECLSGAEYEDRAVCELIRLTVCGGWREPYIYATRPHTQPLGNTPDHHLTSPFASSKPTRQ